MLVASSCIVEFSGSGTPGNRSAMRMSEQVRQFRHSCMVQSIPKRLRGDKELFDFFNQVFPGQVKRVELILTCHDLRELISNRQYYIESYENVYGKLMVHIEAFKTMDSNYFYHSHYSAKHHYRKERYRGTTEKKYYCLPGCLNKEPLEPMIKVKHAKFPKLSYYMNEIQSLNILANNERLRLLNQRLNAVKRLVDFSVHIHRMRSLILPAIDNEFASGTAFVEFNNLATVQSGKYVIIFILLMS